MNKAYAFFCRAYQTVFRAALPILPASRCSSTGSPPSFRC